ncbi:hypothetical protein [Actinomadura rayongensis]|uniref:Uncharacterized protein n=1 Tax=Actinomadura rayongensis TaxID=1429076 RepID=A0A6I4WBZ2_9ACTN|nr:hypothetical protein [Actinomadura rayongensis]
MDVAALIAWLLTAATGAHLLARLVRDGGLRGPAAKVTRHPLLLLGGHPPAALAGFALWAVHLTAGTRWCAWAAFAVLVATALQGFVLFTRWLVGPDGRHARGAPFPAAAVLVHGLGAALTLVLVLATAVRT